MSKEYKNLQPIKNFLTANWFILWFVLLLTTVVNIFIANQVHQATTEMLKEIKESSKKVIALSASGHMIYAEKQSIDVSSVEFQNALKSILVDKLIIDATRVTKNFTKIPKTEDEIVGNYEPLSEFYKKFLAKEALNDFVFYIREIGRLVAREDLVEKIVVLSSATTRYIGNTQGFEIEIISQCGLSYYIEEQDQTKNGVGTITIRATGDFNPSKGTIANPLGVQIKSLKVNPIEKPRDGR